MPRDLIVSSINCSGSMADLLDDFSYTGDRGGPLLDVPHLM